MPEVCAPLREVGGQPSGQHSKAALHKPGKQPQNHQTASNAQKDEPASAVGRAPARQPAKAPLQSAQGRSTSRKRGTTQASPPKGAEAASKAEAAHRKGPLFQNAGRKRKQAVQKLESQLPESEALPAEQGGAAAQNAVQVGAPAVDSTGSPCRKAEHTQQGPPSVSKAEKQPDTSPAAAAASSQPKASSEVAEFKPVGPPGQPPEGLDQLRRQASLASPHAMASESKVGALAKKSAADPSVIELSSEEQPTSTAPLLQQPLASSSGNLNIYCVSDSSGSEEYAPCAGAGWRGCTAATHRDPCQICGLTVIPWSQS